MKIEEIKTIVKLMSENDLTEFKIESDDMSLCLRRGSSNAVAPIVTQVAAPVVASAPASPAGAVPAAPVPAPAAATAASAAAAPAPEKVITAPLVGTFYRSNTPGGEPLAKIGTKVTPDTTVCIVETMKVMSEIKAEKSGVIKEVLVENGQPVEFGQPLFVLE